jgi:uncharacterized protein YqjF (DUF2071 family)
MGRAAGATEAVISGAFRHDAVLTEHEHRPWPLPDREWFMGQTWSALLFAHWPVARRRLEEVVPPQLPLDSFDGRAWIGVTPFEVRGLRLRGTPPMPFVSRFPELNVRTYVTVQDKPGIYFLSLDAARLLAVIAARRVYRLPYFHARMAHRPLGAAIEFASERSSRDGPPAGFAGRYSPAGGVRPPSPGSLEYFLTERYCLYTLDERQRILRGEIHHPPWPLRVAEAELSLNTMVEPFGIPLGGSPMLHFSERQDVAIWPLESAFE